jgi:hypothetical protein
MTRPASPDSVEVEVVAALESALGTPWRENAKPRVLEPADAQTLAQYQARVLTTMAACIRDLAAEVDRLRTDRSPSEVLGGHASRG